ncbi:MAG: rhamnogalacturonan acetylesterase [Bacilli bacterium]|nr:rhamnogalacturonan acetylesterase [Bacilli bacterium]
MKIILMGDSTMQYNDATTYPQTGWGQMLPLFFNQDVAILNFARNGCSTKSFIDLGIFSKALNEVDETTYCLIQFGHNDQKKDNPLRYAERDTDYKDNLRHYIREIINRKGNPILITSVYRRFFDKNDDLIDDVHLGYPKAMMEVAQEMNIPCIDVCCQTKKMISYMGSEYQILNEAGLASVKLINEAIAAGALQITKTAYDAERGWFFLTPPSSWALSDTEIEQNKTEAANATAVFNDNKHNLIMIGAGNTSSDGTITMPTWTEYRALLTNNNYYSVYFENYKSAWNRMKMKHLSE